CCPRRFSTGRRWDFPCRSDRGCAARGTAPPPTCCSTRVRASAASSTPWPSNSCCAITRAAASTAPIACGACSISSCGSGPSSTEAGCRHCPRPRQSMPMRILWLKSDLLLPLDKGGRLRTWHLMRHLARRHRITYLSFADQQLPAAQRDDMSEVCAELVTVPREERPKAGLPFYASVARSLVDPVPYAVGQYRSRAYREAVTRELTKTAYDRIVCDFLVPAINTPKHAGVPSVLFTHNVEAEIWRRHAETERGWLKKRLFRSQWRRMSRFEARTLARFDRILAVSDVDRTTLQTLYADVMG